MKNKFAIIYYSVMALFLFQSCKKDFLSDKPSTNIVQPITLDNLIGLLDNPELTQTTPSLPILSADEYQFIDYPTWQATFDNTQRNAYIWAKDLYSGEPQRQDWTGPYTTIFYTNNVISALKNIKKTTENAAKYDFVEAWALFLRSNSFYDLANSFCKAYDNNTASVDLGIPIRLTPNIDVIEQRATLKQTYDQILSDLIRSKSLISSANAILPTAKKNRPSLVACFGLLARIYLNKGDYQNAELCADSCLKLYANLINYQNIAIVRFPFIQSNEETLFTTGAIITKASNVASNTSIVIDSMLLATYKSGDLRKSILFIPANGGVIMRGNYIGSGLRPYTGIANDEIYLIKAECAARRGDIFTSLNKLNELLIKRYTSAAFIPMTAATPKEALDLVLLERRKELVWRGLRWFDIKRLNKAGAEISLIRLLNGVTYTLLPNDTRYIFPIPDDEIALTGIAQNNR